MHRKLLFQRAVATEIAGHRQERTAPGNTKWIEERDSREEPTGWFYTRMPTSTGLWSCCPSSRTSDWGADGNRRERPKHRGATCSGNGQRLMFSLSAGALEASNASR
jgi:hypothetical protein